MRGSRRLSGLLLIVAMLAAIPASAAPPEPPSAHDSVIIRVAQYRASAAGSIKIDWKYRSGEVDKSCASWADESGTSEVSFTRARGSVSDISSSGRPFTLSGFLVGPTLRKRKFTGRYGTGEQGPGCPGVCPPGTSARAADGTCERAIDRSRVGKNDCGTRTTKRTQVAVRSTSTSGGDDDLGPDDESGPRVFIGPPLFQKAGFLTCEARGDQLEQEPFPIDLTAGELRRIRALDKGRSLTVFDANSVPCYKGTPPAGVVKCVATWSAALKLTRID